MLMDDIVVELEAVRSRNLKIIYLFYSSSTNKLKSESLKTNICNKLISEFKYNFLSFNDCINEEIKNVKIYYYIENKTRSIMEGTINKRKYTIRP